MSLNTFDSLRALHTRYGQQFPRVVLTKSLLISCLLCRVHEKSLIEGVCHLNYHKDEGRKYLNFVFLCVPLATELQKLHVTLLTLASVNGIIGLVTMED